MKHRFLLFKFLLIAFFALSSYLSYAQSVVDVPLTGSKMRVPLDVSRGVNTVTLSQLIPGNTYVVRASRAVQGQNVTLELSPDAAVNNASKVVSLASGQKNVIRFTAKAAQVSFALNAITSQQVSSVPLFLSVHCETCVEEFKSGQGSLAESLANLQVTANVPAQSLIRNTLIGGDCFSVSNVTSSGNALARGTFSNGGTNIGLGSGMVMSTGRINILPGPNVAGDADGGFGPQGTDADLSSLVFGDLHDVNIIEFDFIPTANTVQFDFVFGSEEYCEYVGTEFNDVFGFFISGPGISGSQNLAVIPGTGGVPVAINNVNHENNTNFYVNNNLGFFNCDFLPANHLAECELDGWTTPLTALVTVAPCSTYHIKLAIADVNDELWDSAVFLRANSFNAGGTVSASPAYQNNLNSAYESCAPGRIRFARGNSDVSQPLTVNFTVSPSSTATPGVDYTPITSPVVIPAGQSEIFLPVNILSDGLVEGQETIILLIDNSCQCTQAQVQFLINDNLAFTTQIEQDTTICEGRIAALNAVPDGGIEPYLYSWNTGASSQGIVVTPSTSTTYTVTVTDACGETATDHVLVDVIPPVRSTVYAVICAGGFFTIGGITYTTAATVQDTSYEAFLCGEITTYNISLAAPAQGADTIYFCKGDIVNIQGELYGDPGMVLESFTTPAGCDSIVTHTLIQLPLSFGAETVTFCPGTTVELNGTVYNDSGTVLDTLTAASGCDSIVTYTLIRLPQPTKSETITFCPGESVVLGGNVYTQPGVVTLTLTASVDCDTIATYNLVFAPEPTRAQTIQFCPGESVTLGGAAYTQPGVVVVHEPASVGCDTIVTYTLVFAPEPTRSQTIKFCPGESVSLGGNVYTQPGVVVLQEAASVGCDTIVTYTLEYSTPAPSTVTINCPHPISYSVLAGSNTAVITYNDAVASTNCPCPGLDVTRVSGLASGSTFPMGVTSVCYQAQDACGQTTSCCFKVSVMEEDPCDVKEIGCMKYELLTITQDQFKNKTYRVRVTNFCPNELIYTAIQTPSGLVAMAPATNTIFTAPSGNEYLVRNPNFAPMYSVRYRALNGGIANGEADILRYTLPAQAEVLFIDVISRLSIQVYYEAHMNTFYCPVGVTPLDQRSEEGAEALLESYGAVAVFPNPSDGSFQVDLAAWEGETVNLQVFNSQGQRVLFNTVTAALTPQGINLPQGTADGLYFLEAATEQGDKEVVKFVVKH